MFSRREPPVKISGGFLLLVAWFALENGWRPLAAILSAAAVHELGHLAALRFFRVPVTAFRLCIFGAELQADRSRLSYGGELTVLMAGPWANLLCGWMLSTAARGHCWMYLAAGAHLLLGLFNLLPVRALDGGQALLLLIHWHWGPNAGERLCDAVNTVCAASIAAGLVLLMRTSGGSLWLLPAAGAALRAAFPRRKETECASC